MLQWTSIQGLLVSMRWYWVYCENQLGAAGVRKLANLQSQNGSCPGHRLAKVLWMLRGSPSTPIYTTPSWGPPLIKRGTNRGSWGTRKQFWLGHQGPGPYVWGEGVLCIDVGVPAINITRGRSFGNCTRPKVCTWYSTVRRIKAPMPFVLG